MKIDNPEGDGQIEVFTPQELQDQIAAKEKELSDKHISELSKKDEDLAKAKRIAAEQTQNFKLLRDMTDEEKSKMTEQQIASQKVLEQALEKNKILEDRLTAKEKADLDAAKEEAISRLVGSDEELKKKLMESYELVNLAGTDRATITKRVEFAWNMLGMGTKINPLTQDWSGEAPGAKDKKDFSESDRGKTAKDAMKRAAGSTGSWWEGAPKK